MAAGTDEVNADKDYGDFKPQNARTLQKKPSVNQGSGNNGSSV